ncbi:hypothetical protein DF3PB_1370005 [uncultured Defluviicoccus sp.]|uniref:Uncharacterized protein n=1 Tax=metagenome TaxID=256318 RepID=A0A380T9I1_9ZZZZ|nr:hypothetical protein DF3PB_1370005 [uncultured Defluviicoccus sp.]
MGAGVAGDIGPDGGVCIKEIGAVVVLGVI